MFIIQVEYKREKEREDKTKNERKIKQAKKDNKDNMSKYEYWDQEHK